MVNRRMFRPGFPDVKEQSAPRPSHNGPVPSKKPAPPETTHAENFYWVKHMQSHTPMAVVLEGGEVPPATLRQTLREGLRRGLIRRSEIAEARKHLADGKQLRTSLQKVAP